MTITVLHGRPIEDGKQYRFDYPEEFMTLDEYSAHRGCVVTVLRICNVDEADPIIDDDGNGEEVFDLMFKVRAADGWEGAAWHSELVPIA